MPAEVESMFYKINSSTYSFQRHQMFPLSSLITLTKFMKTFVYASIRHPI